MARPKAEKRSWIVDMKCTITKEVVTRDCTEQQARTNPFEFAVEETETGQDDYEVTDVSPNE